ncbi:protein kinase [Kocuria sp. M1R5S2]|uniref:protein kinase n=1 Tax=Kocuria rhizosphaerae TaxID=3376285 RepID=UPI00379C67A2
MDHASHQQHAPLEPVGPVPAARDRIAAAVRAHGAGTAVGAPPVPPRLPPEEGLEPVRLLGGDAWLVREGHSGEHFVLHLCSGGTAPERERSWAGARALAVALAGCEDPHVVAVRGLLGPAAEPVGVVEENLAGGSLADRLVDRARPDSAELCPVLRDAAAGLAVLHGRGRCHGALTARQILFRGPPAGATITGADAPPPAAIGPGTGAGSRPEDVRALGVVAWTALTGRAPGEGAHRVPLTVLRPDVPPGLIEVVTAALAEDPADRPVAAQLAARFARAAEEPPPVVPGPRRRPVPRVRHVRRSAALLAGGAVLVLGGALVGPAATPDGPQEVPRVRPRLGPAESASVPSAFRDAAGAARRQPAGAAGGPVPGGPREALEELVALRGTALRTGDAGLLEEVYAPGAEAAAADRRLLERTAGDGARPFGGLELSVGEARQVERGGPAGPPAAAYMAEVHVRGHRGEPGNAPGVVAAGDTWVQTVEVVVVRTARGWRLGEVVPAPAGGPERSAPPAPGTTDPRR